MKSISSEPRAGFGLDAGEKRALADDGYVVRRGEFRSGEVAAIAALCEELTADVVRDRAEHRFNAGSYVFDPDLSRYVIIKWEDGTDVVHGLEPFAHLSPELDEWAHDRRFLDPMRDLTGHPEPMLFTEKLNLKRAGYGGPNPLHRDFPYWKPATPRAAKIATSMLFLDDADRQNGCLWVLPGSHGQHRWKGRTDGDAFLANEIDTTELGDLELTPLEVEAGSVVHFGAFLVHRSAPNTSDRDRRALSFSYQPPIEPCPTQLELLQELASTAP